MRDKPVMAVLPGEVIRFPRGEIVHGKSEKSFVQTERTTFLKPVISE